MAIISRKDAEALISEQLAAGIIQDVPKKSAFMSLARRLPNMTSKQTRLRVLDTLPMAYWVDGDTGLKQTSKQAWDNVYLTAAELAVIVPIPEAVLSDSDIDIFGEVIPRCEEAMAQRIDSAIIFGNNMPKEWDLDLVSRARQAGNNVAVGVNDWYDLILSDGGAFSKVETDGYAVNGAIASLAMKAKLRGLRTQDGLPIFSASMQQANTYTLDGSPLYFLDNGAFDANVAQLIVGDFTQAVFAVRQDVTVKILDQGVITDSEGNIVYNLSQQDMVALRIVFRCGFALPNPATRLDEDRAGFPFAYVEAGTPVTTQQVEFTVTDTSESPIEGAKINVEGAILKTDSSGVATFNLRTGTYTAKISAEGYNTVTETVTVVASKVEKEVTLVNP